jgi:hypothetical protein
MAGRDSCPATRSSRRPIIATRRFLAWIHGHGQVAAIGVESNGSFGATLTRALTRAGERVVEVNRPNRLPAAWRLVRPPPRRADCTRGPGQTSTAKPRAKSGPVEVTVPGPGPGDGLAGRPELLRVGRVKPATGTACQDRVALRLRCSSVATVVLSSFQLLASASCSAHRLVSRSSRHLSRRPPRPQRDRAGNAVMRGLVLELRRDHDLAIASFVRSDDCTSCRITS